MYIGEDGVAVDDRYWLPATLGRVGGKLGLDALEHARRVRREARVERLVCHIPGEERGVGGAVVSAPW